MAEASQQPPTTSPAHERLSSRENESKERLLTQPQPAHVTRSSDTVGLTLGAVMVLVAAIYYACPAVKKNWQWIRPGSALFTLGFLGASTAFSYYVGRFGAYDKTYGSLGAIIILLLWMYLLALFLLFGGELNALLEERLVRRGEAPVPEIRTDADGQPQAVAASAS